MKRNNPITNFMIVKTLKKHLAVLSVLLVMTPAVYAQKVTAEFRNTPVADVLKEIEKQTGCSFVYKTSDIKEAKASGSFKDAPLADVLLKVITPPLTYSIEGNIIAISNDSAPKAAREQSSRLKVRRKGVIRDVSGDPLVGASVLIKGTQTGVVSDIDGRYEIAASSADALVFSYLGYVDKEISLKGLGTDVDVILESDMQFLDEVVVTGYGTTTRKNLTTAIATVKPNAISKAANSSMQSLLMGRVAGMNAAINSTQPGGSVSISIRGGGTPVYVVDGIVMQNNDFDTGTGNLAVPSSVSRGPLGGLNPSDIESIEVLKDASAAIYGIGAANGVILITTKKGKTGKPTVTYDGSYSYISNYKHLDMVDGPTLMNLVNIYSKESFLYDRGYYPYGSTTYDGSWSPIFSPEQIRNAITTDWLDFVLKSGHVNNHNATVSGGTEKFKYYLGANWYDEAAVVHNSDMRRFSVRTNVSSQITDWLSLGAVMNYSRNNYTNSTNGGDKGNLGNQGAGALYAATTYPSYLPVKDENGKYSRYDRTPNPVSVQDLQDHTKMTEAFVNFSLDATLVKDWLTLKGVYGINMQNNYRNAYIPSYVYFALQEKSRGSISSGRREATTYEAFLNFQHKLGEIVDVSAMFGVGLYFDEGTTETISYDNANDHIAGDNLSMADGPFIPASGRWKNEKRSQFARVSFDFLDRYIVSASFRRDGSDKFFPGKKYALFSSVSAAWKISDEPWMANVTAVNLLKLRASWGETGSDNLGTTLWGTVGVSREDVQFNHNSTSYVPFLTLGANYPDVTWQKTVMKNIGLDWSLFKDRVTGSLDFWRNDVTNLLGTAPTELLGMFSDRPVNSGHYYRAGIDFSVSTVNINTRNFKWTSVLNLSHDEAYWVERQVNYAYKPYQKQVKEPMNAYYHFKYDGLINYDLTNMPQSQRSLGAKACQPGFPIIVDKNKDGKIDIDDIYMEDNRPKIQYGFGNTFTWKNFDLDIFLYGQAGHRRNNDAVVMACSPTNLAKGVDARNVSTFVYEMWNSQTGLAGTEPGIAYYKNVTLPENVWADVGMEDAWFIRVRNITFGYNFPERILSRMGGFISSLRIYVDFQNPFTFTAFRGYDPEINTAGGTLRGGLFPMVRNYTAGLKITF